MKKSSNKILLTNEYVKIDTYTDTSNTYSCVFSMYAEWTMLICQNQTKPKNM